MALTDRTIRNAKPKSSVYRLRDTNALTKGFGVAVAPAGSKTFFLSYTSPGTEKRTQVSLGRYPGVSLKDARAKALAYREKLSTGIDPKEEAEEARRQRKKLAERPRVIDLFTAYIENLEEDGKRSAKEVRRIFKKHIADLIGDQVAAEITTDDILDVLTPIASAGALVHADNVRAYLRAAFEFGLHARSMPNWRSRVPDFGLTHNPVAQTKRSVRHKRVGQRALSADELCKFWFGAGISEPSHLAIKLLLSSGQRVEEVLQARWPEFDLKQMLWTIPADRRKSRHEVGEPHLVPLTGLHVGLLRKVQAVTADQEWLFPHRDGGKPRKSDGLYQALQRFCSANEIQPFAPRDCRRTFKTLAGSIGISLEMRNRLQGHAMTDVGSVHYDRWGYLPEKREAMETWTNWLDQLLVRSVRNGG